MNFHITIDATINDLPKLQALFAALNTSECSISSTVKPNPAITQAPEVFTPSHAFKPDAAAAYATAKAVLAEDNNIISTPTVTAYPAAATAIIMDEAIAQQEQVHNEQVAAGERTVEDIRQVVLQIPPTKRIDTIKAVVTAFNVAKISDIPQASLTAAYNMCHAALS
jgi:hypothetical protein